MEIFSYLDAEDVLNCEMVSLQWNRVVRSVRYNWEELYDRHVTKFFLSVSFISFIVFIQMQKWHAIWKCDERHPFWNQVSKLNYKVLYYLNYRFIFSDLEHFRLLTIVFPRYDARAPL